MRGLLRSSWFACLYIAAVCIAALLVFQSRKQSFWLDNGAPSKALAQPFCSAGPPFDRPFEKPHWNGWGAGSENRHSQPQNMAGLPRDQVSRLKLKWAFGVPGVTGMWSQPTVVGGRVFLGSQAGKVFSLDAATGCTYWVFDAGANVRGAISIGPIGGHWAAYFGDSGVSTANAYAVDAITGQLLWKTVVDDSPYARISGSPVLESGRLYVPVTGNEDALAAKPGSVCCKFRGSLVSLDAATGKLIWKTYTISEEAHATRKNVHGVQQWGPSGAGIWSAPTVDAEKRVVYTATGDSHSAPATLTSDAILAFDMDTGAMLWSRQMTPRDVWNMACVQGDPANCPDEPGEDLDFGSSPILVDLPQGRRALIAAQKSGVVYALDPDHRGNLLWQRRIGKGGNAGGIQWGAAADEKNVYAALSDLKGAFTDELRSPFRSFWLRAKRRYLTDDGGGTFALNLESGQPAWTAEPQCDGPGMCKPAQLAAITNIPGVVFSGSMDGYLRAYSTDDGKVLWANGTARDYVTVNGVKGHGGTISGPGPVVAGGVLYVNSGYLMPRGLAGNVLLAFSVDGL